MTLGSGSCRLDSRVEPGNDDMVWNSPLGVMPAQAGIQEVDVGFRQLPAEFPGRARE